MQKNEPLNTIPIQQFISQVKSADLGNAKEVKLSVANARRLAYCLGEVMTRLEGDLEELLLNKNSNTGEVIQVKMDGGSDW